MLEAIAIDRRGLEFTVFAAIFLKLAALRCKLRFWDRKQRCGTSVLGWKKLDLAIASLCQLWQIARHTLVAMGETEVGG